MSKYQWKEEGAGHVLDFQSEHGVFTIHVDPNYEGLPAKRNEEFPWVMTSTFTHKSAQHDFRCTQTHKLREPEEKDAKAKAVFLVQCNFLTGLTKINVFYGKNPFDGT